ncbi:MAG: hypothetical protein OEZ58_02355, partial [Gammaproteobacteria bacterium]|nr:hypothetical protein [Gammaproteobacteria bacterium]
MSNEFPFNLRSYNTDQLYDYLKDVFLRAKKHYGLDADNDYKFREGNLEVNLISVRGFYKASKTPVKRNRNDVWDDTLFVVRKDEHGKKTVESFRISTEHKPGRGMSLMMPGMYRYRLHFHKWPEMKVYTEPTDAVSVADRGEVPTAIEPKPLLDMNSNSYSNPEVIQESALGHLSVESTRKSYRAMRIAPGQEPAKHPSHLNQIVDTNGDLKLGAGEKLSFSESLNIHYGGAKETGPGGYSEGCQVIGKWHEYKRFIRMLEKDPKLIGRMENQLEPPAAEEGSEYAIYTLVEGEFLKPLSVSSLLLDTEVKDLPTLHDQRQGGNFPIGKNGFWHGGLHLSIDAQKPIRCVADGEVVAYRINQKPHTAQFTQRDGSIAEKIYSSGFALVKHKIETPLTNTIEFYSLYMHLLDFESLKAQAFRPAFLSQWSYRIAVAPDGAGLNVRSKTDFAKVEFVLPKGAVAVVKTDSKPPTDWAKESWAKRRNVIWYEIEYQGKSGYGVYKAGSKRKIKKREDRRYVCVVAEDKPSTDDTGLMGLNIYESKNLNSVVTKIVKKGNVIEFLNPERVGYDGL